MKGAATLYHTLTTGLKATYETHPAFAGRKPHYQLTVVILVSTALGIISYSTTILFS